MSLRSAAQPKKSRTSGALGGPSASQSSRSAWVVPARSSLAGGQEAQEGDGGVEVHLGVAGGGARRPGRFGPLAGTAQHPPRRIRTQQPALALVLDVRQSFADPGLEAHQGVVAGGEYAVGDEQVAEVVGPTPGRVGVEGLVGEGELAGGDLARATRPATERRSQLWAL